MNLKFIHFAILLFLLKTCDSRRWKEECSKEDPATCSKKSRTGKLFPIFQVYSFKNGPCIGGTKNGTCYTANECAAKGGVSEGSCASNFGVCCTFTSSCGATSSENCTYFESSGATAGGCSLKICKCDSNICQLRLDFNQFSITGPSTDTNSVGKTIFGQLNGATFADVTSATQCLTDTFTVLNPGGSNPSPICGINSGEHMYVDASDACNDLTFQLGNQGVGTGIQNRQWSIKVNQYSCDYNNLAPPGCTQYYFGSTSDTVQTYNYQGESHLANQNQNICIRRERGNCRICWATAQEGDFNISKKGGANCCGYGTDGKATTGYDCVSIPGALNTKSSKAPSMICGTKLNTIATGDRQTVCSTRTPFYLRFLSDQYEQFVDPTIGGDQGFRLTYIQSATNC